MTVTINGTTGVTTPGLTNTGSGTVAGTQTFATTISVGGVTPANTGAGITFPATQSASSDANTLDDYEEGTWTPVFNRGTTNPTLTYSSQGGTYTKIGRYVYAQWDFTVNTISAQGSGQLVIAGLPFSTLNDTSTGGYSRANWRSSGAIPAGPTATTVLAGYIYGATVYPEYDNTGNAGFANNSAVTGSINAGGRCAGFIVYQVI